MDPMATDPATTDQVAEDKLGMASAVQPLKTQQAITTSEEQLKTWPLPMLEKGITEKSRMEVFKTRIDVILSNFKINNINKVDLIVVPIIKSEHVLLLVFDLKNPSVVIIGNMQTYNSSFE
ncbi:hypothetical protein R6Q57_018466 [Mikania cordata]